MGKLLFSFDEMQREIQDFFAMSREFLDLSAERCLRGLSDRLGIIRSKAPLTGGPAEDKKWQWRIGDHEPLLTKPTRGYEKGQRTGGPAVSGRLTLVWEITPVPRKSKSDVSKRFQLTGNASVRVEWVDHATHESMGSWRMEVGDEGAPGCFFHVQILGDAKTGPFPHSLPVPRLPCIVYTPMAVLEFMLGELFQDKWEKHSLGPSKAMEGWRAAQKRQLTNLLTWQQQIVRDSPGPPWTALKTEPLHSTLIVDRI